MDPEFTKPILTEPGVKYFLNETLKQCRRVKAEWNDIMYNVLFFIIFIVILGILLLYKYKGKLTPEEIEIKETQKKHYILSKIRNFQDAKLRAQQELITGLPHWENEFDIPNNSLDKIAERLLSK